MFYSNRAIAFFDFDCYTKTAFLKIFVERKDMT